jgi:hypothetical protein
MKKSVLLFTAILLALTIIRCTEDSGDAGSTEKSGDITGFDLASEGYGSGSSAGSPGSGSGDSTQQQPVNPGQITAAEWNDLLEWDFWLDLGQNTEFNQAKVNWLFNPSKRYSFVVKDIQSFPVTGCEVTLKNIQGDILWKSLTDNEGKAELWLNLNGGSEDQPTATLKYLNEKITIADPVEIGAGINEVTMATIAATELTADILFVVDATGSMTDEINYLKSELLDVIGRVGELNSQLSLRVGSVFYRDEGDEFLTRVSPFSTDLSSTLNFINNQEADGGGDYEEAVHTALNTAITQLSWSENARARLLFLLLDAPPHHTNAIVSDLNDIIMNAAEKGIKIIPVSASGINKDTEFLFRFFATATNGTYVFITNDSGIGGDHIQATVGDYEIELLNDLIVRLITRYTL